MSKLALVFILGFVYCVYAALFVAPSIGFYFYEVNYFLNPRARWWFSGVPSLNYSFIISSLILVAYVFHLRKFTNNTFARFPGFKWFVLIFLSYVVALFWAVSPEQHSRFTYELLKQVIIIVVAYRILDSEAKLKYALLFYAVGAAYIGFEAMNVGRDSWGRVEGIGMVDSPDSNSTAASLVAILPVLIYFGWRLNWKYKVAVAILGALIANGIVLINSRGAFLGAAVGVGYFLMFMMFSKYKLPKQRVMLLVIFVGVAGATIRVTDATFWERMATIDDKSSKESEGSGGRRINFWLATFDMLEDQPQGIGIFGYQTWSPFYLKDDSYFEDVIRDQGVKFRAVHSIWFQALAEIGWHGFIFFLALLLSLWRGVLKARKLAASVGNLDMYYMGVAIEAGCISFLLAASFIDAFRIQLLYWLILYCATYCAIVNGRLAPNTETETAPAKPTRYPRNAYGRPV
ncbi:O-antigen ligase family protein [Alteromonas sp. ASW11-19]|uniref:O-antigen ligase family protein n=1 Tax=Alteromonas salexigens TaxID=2982530 RepID=A0ABT2VRD8_9ALTE|nr:O-antigen ligase family protein [Alteromonas salexigens]MCU7555624.1 O-antigen ligase family protein [Alteromonas salexigens]